MKKQLHISLSDNLFREQKTIELKMSMRNFLIISAAILLLHFALHGPFLISDYFGEQDAARIAIDSIKASQSGSFHDAEYTIYSSPLYNNVISFMIKAGLISHSNIPICMAIASFIASAVITVSMLIIVFQLTSSFAAAILATVFLQGIPIFWISSIYGFSTIVALAFFLLSFILFSRSIGEDQVPLRYFLILGSSVLYVLAVMCKVDVLLASIIFCLPVWQGSRSLWNKLVWAVCLGVFTVFVFFLFNQYAGILINSSQNSPVFIKKFNTAFTSQFSNLYSRKHFAVAARAAGLLTIPAAIVSATVVGWRREWKITTICLVLAALPLFLFWGMKPANIARHYLIPNFFLCILIALPLSYRKSWKWVWTGFLGLVFLVNYFSFPPVSTTFYPSGKLFASARSLESRVKDLHHTGQVIAHMPYEKVAVIGKKWIHPYFRFEILRSNTPWYITRVSKGIEREYQMQYKNRSFLWLYGAEVPRIVELTEHGYFIVICDDTYGKDLVRLSMLKDKWIYIDDLNEHFMH